MGKYADFPRGILPFIAYSTSMSPTTHIYGMPHMHGLLLVKSRAPLDIWGV